MSAALSVAGQRGRVAAPELGPAVRPAPGEGGAVVRGPPQRVPGGVTPPA